MTALAMRHRHEPPTDPSVQETLLLLHGTGGSEDDLLPLGPLIAPGAGLLSPRGSVLERGMPRFFRRLAEGVFDLEDLALRTDELASFVEGAARTYGFDPARVIALGFSNGANIAASLLLRRPGTLAGAILLRPMLPFEPEALPDLAGRRVLVAPGRDDPIVPAALSARLAEVLRSAGAEVTVETAEATHMLTRADFAAAQRWWAARPR